MITALFQVQNAITKEVFTVDSFVNCSAICFKGNDITKKQILEVCPATKQSIDKFCNGCVRKPIFTVSNEDEKQEYNEENDYVIDDHFAKNFDRNTDWDFPSVKERVAKYLSNFKNETKIIKAKKRKGKNRRIGKG